MGSLHILRGVQLIQSLQHVHDSLLDHLDRSVEGWGRIMRYLGVTGCFQLDATLSQNRESSLTAVLHKGQNDLRNKSLSTEIRLETGRST